MKGRERRRGEGNARRYKGTEDSSRERDSMGMGGGTTGMEVLLMREGEC